MKLMMNRRSFLAAAAAAAFAPAMLVRAAETKRKVVVVGGGLAGLSCAYELRKLGLEAIVLEGQGRPGGRVETLREGLDPGLMAETGGTRIPDTHHMTLDYVREFGLPLEVFKGGDFADVLQLRGKNYVTGRGPEPDWPLQLSPEERRLGRAGMANRYLNEPLALAKGSENSLSVPTAILNLDHDTLQGYLEKQGLSRDAIELVTLGGDTSLGVAQMLMVGFNQQVIREFFHIRGGNNQLPGALARRLELAGAIRYGCQVTSVGQDNSSAWAVMEHAGGHETVRGDHVVSALPFSISRNMFTDARLSAEKQRVIREQKYFPADKIFLQMQKQFWKEKGLRGFANTDLVSERFWALGPESPEERGLLLSYVIGERAEKLDAMDAESRVSQTLADAESVFPGAREHFEAARVKIWSEDPWQRGALSRFEPGQLNRIPINARREGRIFFAGEHTSRWNGWMQGAIESAHRVVREISA
jgi:monoamine oxidase